MERMLPSPGDFISIPSIGTPLHQPEEDQQILAPNSPIPPRQQVSNGFGLTLPHQQQNNSAASSQPLYSMPGFTPQHMLQPQTPVNFYFSPLFVFINMLTSQIIAFVVFSKL